MPSVLACVFVFGVLTVTGAPATDDLVLTIEIRAARKGDNPAVTQHPWHYELFEKRIKDVEDKLLPELMGTKLSIRLLNNRPGLGRKREPYTGADFACAILRGKVIPNAKMHYHLQSAEECLVATPGGDFKVGIYYPPIGYIFLPNGECYWFLFGEKSK